MGRRGRKRDEEEDDDDHLEREYLKRKTIVESRSKLSDRRRKVEVRKDETDGTQMEEEKSGAANSGTAGDTNTLPTAPPIVASIIIDRNLRKKQKLKERRKKRARRGEEGPAASHPEVQTGKEGTTLGRDDGTKEEEKSGTARHDSIDEKSTALMTLPTSDDEDRINRMRLKKQRQKQRQKEKKAAASEAASERRQKQQDHAAAMAVEKRNNSKVRDNIKSPQFVTGRMGVKYRDVQVGKGMVVQDRKKIRVKYTLRAKAHGTGKVLDSGLDFRFRIGKGEVIKGWDVGLEGMRCGGLRHLIVPCQAGYGPHKDVGAGKGADLFFEIFLLSC